MEHRLDPLIQRVHEEHREYLDRGAGVPLRRLRVDAGAIAICGDSEGIDRRGRQAITFVRPDGRLTLLTLADEADVDAQCVKYKAAPLALVEPYRVFFRGRPREFRATARPFLMGVCDCEGETILVACVDGGLLFCVTVDDGASRTWARFAEASWAPFDLDNALGVQSGADPVEPPQVPRARAKGRGPSRRVEDCDEEVQEHHERLAAGVVPEQRCMSILETCFEQLHQKAQLPNAAFGGRYFEGRKDTAAVAAGLLKAIANGCGDLGGRESDMRDTLKGYGVVIPRGALSAVLRGFMLLGCPLVSQPAPAKGRKVSKRFNVDVVAALDPKNPKHLALLRSIDTPLRKPSAAAAEGPPGDAQGPASEASESATAAGKEREARASEPEPPPEAAPGDPTTGGLSGAAAVDMSARRGWLAEPIQACIGLVFGTLSLLTQEIVRLHQRLDAATHVGAPGEDRLAAGDAPAAAEPGRPDGTPPTTQATDTVQRGQNERPVNEHRGGVGVDPDELEAKRVDAEQNEGAEQAGDGGELRGTDGAAASERGEVEMAREASTPAVSSVDVVAHAASVVTSRPAGWPVSDGINGPDVERHVDARPHDDSSLNASLSSHADVGQHIDPRPHAHASPDASSHADLGPPADPGS